MKSIILALTLCMYFVCLEGVTSYPLWQPDQDQHLGRRTFGSLPVIGGLSKTGEVSAGLSIGGNADASVVEPSPTSYRNKGM